jgi:putative transposase
MRRHCRKLNRLSGYDYAQDGWYFVTICTKNRHHYFGEIINGKMVLNTYGDVANKCWQDIPHHFPHCMLDEYIIMPDHIHGILVIDNDRTVGNKDFCSLHNFCSLRNFCSKQKSPWQTQLSRSLSSIVRGFKIGVTKYCRNDGDIEFAWQKSFHDHIIRDEHALHNIRQYIISNPMNWDL